MDWNQIEGNWKQFKGNAKEQWGKLTDNDLKVLEGKKDRLVGKIQEYYGIAKEEAENQVNEWATARDEYEAEEYNEAPAKNAKKKSDGSCGSCH